MDYPLEGNFSVRNIATNNLSSIQQPNEEHLINTTLIGGGDDNILVQMDKICRCCLSDRTELRTIFDNENCIPEMIMAFAAVQVILF